MSDEGPLSEFVLRGQEKIELESPQFAFLCSDKLMNEPLSAHKLRVCVLIDGLHFRRLFNVVFNCLKQMLYPRVSLALFQTLVHIQRPVERRDEELSIEGNLLSPSHITQFGKISLDNFYFFLVERELRVKSD